MDKNLKDIRKKLNMTQEDAAKYLEIGRRTYQNYEDDSIKHSLKYELYYNRLNELYLSLIDNNSINIIKDISIVVITIGDGFDDTLNQLKELHNVYLYNEDLNDLDDVKNNINKVNEVFILEKNYKEYNNAKLNEAIKYAYDNDKFVMGIFNKACNNNLEDLKEYLTTYQLIIEDNITNLNEGMKELVINNQFITSINSVIYTAEVAGLINIDLYDIKTVTKECESASYMVSGSVEELVDDILPKLYNKYILNKSLSDVTKMCVNILGSGNINLNNICEIIGALRKRNDVNIIYGSGINTSNDITVIIIAS